MSIKKIEEIEKQIKYIDCFFNNKDIETLCYEPSWYRFNFTLTFYRNGELTKNIYSDNIEIFEPLLRKYLEEKKKLLEKERQKLINKFYSKRIPWWQKIFKYKNK